LMQLVQVFRARIVDVGPESLIIETTGAEDKVDGLIDVLRAFGIIEMVRTGRVGMARGKSAAVEAEALPQATSAVQQEEVYRAVSD